MSDGGAPLIGYVVEMRVQGSAKKGDDAWKRCNVAAQLIVCEFTVTSLDEKLVYEFRVSAQNQVGMSLPCDLDGAVIPRDILGKDIIGFYSILMEVHNSFAIFSWFYELLLNYIY